MRNFIKEIKYWGQIFLLPIFLLSHLIPRSKKIWVLGSTFGKRFADNPKYFYLYLNQYRSEQVRAIWISKNNEVIQMLEDNNLEGYYLYSLKGIWYSLRAKVYLYDNYSKDICFTLSGGAVKINLWHGIPLKKIQKDNRFDRVRNPRTGLEKFRWGLRRMTDEKSSDYVLATSDLLKPIFESAFCTKRVLICGYPRNDNLIVNIIKNIITMQEQDALEQLMKKKIDNRIAFYIPTFRESEAKFFDIVSIDRLKVFLKSENIIFCVKLHPKSRMHNQFMEIAGDNLLVLDPQFDPHPFLNITDVLVTDYSSIYFDFLITRKPIIFFPYDLNEYLNYSREMYFDYEEFTPGQKVYYQSELESALTESYYNEREIKEVCEKVFGKAGTLASEQLYALTQRILDCN